MAVIGYARVSTDGQTLDAQAEQLEAAGADMIFQEKVSGARADRKALADALRTLNKDDVLLVTRLDRLYYNSAWPTDAYSPWRVSRVRTGINPS